MKLSKLGACALSTSPHDGKRESGITGSHSSDNVTNRIGCTEEDKRMQTDLESTLSRNDVQYIRNLLAEGIARMLVGKVAKNTVPAVDSSEPERYNPSPQKEVSS